VAECLDVVVLEAGRHAVKLVLRLREGLLRLLLS
jgi:hypothetical protein